MATTDELLATRQSTHGNFEDSAETVQCIKNIMRKSPNWGRMSMAQREALDMIQHKIGRVLHGDYTCVDHFEDIQGYAKLGTPK